MLGKSVEDLDLGLRREKDITIEQVFDDVRRTGRSLTYEVQDDTDSASARTVPAMPVSAAGNTPGPTQNAAMKAV